MRFTTCPTAGPKLRGGELEAAQLSCVQMLKRRGRCDEARNAFVVAALKADVLVI